MARKNVDEVGEKDLVSNIQCEHPTRILNVRTTSSNLKRAPDHKSDLASEIKTCLQEAVCIASNTKRACQRDIGLYIERISTTNIDETDRALLDVICPRISDKDVASNGDPEEDGEKAEKDGDENSVKNKPASFVSSLLQCIYSRDPSRDANGSPCPQFHREGQKFLACHRKCR
jgi:hypothetical protein